jgi:uncharacterized Zn-finger protein
MSETGYLECEYCGDEYHLGWEADGAGRHEPFMCKGQP